MKKFKNIPAFVTLLAGFVSSVVMIIHKYTIVEFLWFLAGVMVLFYVIGLLFRFVLNKAFSALEEKKSKEESEVSEDTENIENIEDSEDMVTEEKQENKEV